jgi:hypothetical protein
MLKAGVDVHKKMLALVVSDLEVDAEYDEGLAATPTGASLRRCYHSILFCFHPFANIVNAMVQPD